MTEQTLELKLEASCWTSVSFSRTLEDAQSVHMEREMMGVNKSKGGGAALDHTYLHIYIQSSYKSFSYLHSKQL